MIILDGPMFLDFYKYLRIENTILRLLWVMQNISLV